MMQERDEDIYAHSESPHTVSHRDIYADQEYTRPHPSIPGQIDDSARKGTACPLQKRN
jgi:hypothetical protein